VSTDRTERDWIARAKAGDQRAMKALHDAHAARVHSLVRRIAGDDALAEDLTQESWIRAFASLDRFRGDARFSTWLHRIAVNTALNARRRMARREALESEAAPKQTPGSAADAILMRVRLDRALDDLPDGMRTVLVLHDGQGYRHQDIAKMLGVSVGTSKSQLFRARAKMRGLLRQAPVERSKVESRKLKVNDERRVALS
jgi:RNA polymerase sigma-70 factor (ECF subfamily)